VTVEEAAGAHRDDCGSRRASIDAAVGSDARWRARSSPRSLRALRAKRDRDQKDAERRRQRTLASHRAASRRKVDPERVIVAELQS
jgi:hypothetical protein